MNTTGRLENWTYDRILNVVWGNIYGDVHERFWDGAYIHTSDIPGQRHKGLLSEGDYIKTLNSVYLLGKPLKKED